MKTLLKIFIPFMLIFFYFSQNAYAWVGGMGALASMIMAAGIFTISIIALIEYFIISKRYREKIEYTFLRVLAMKTLFFIWSTLLLLIISLIYKYIHGTLYQPNENFSYENFRNILDFIMLIAGILYYTLALFIGTLAETIPLKKYLFSNSIDPEIMEKRYGTLFLMLIFNACILTIVYLFMGIEGIQTLM